MRGPIIIVTVLIGGVLGGCLLAFSPQDSKGGLLAGQYLTNVSPDIIKFVFFVSLTIYDMLTKVIRSSAPHCLYYTRTAPQTTQVILRKLQ